MGLLKELCGIRTVHLLRKFDAHAKGDSIFWRSSGSNPLAAGEGPGKTSIISGTGKYKGISGSGTMTWKQSVANVTDPMRWGHTYKGSLKIHMP